MINALLFDLDQVKVYQRDNRKGNPRVVVEVMDTRILYADVHDMRRDDNLKHYVSVNEHNELVVDCEMLANYARSLIGQHFREILKLDKHVFGSDVFTNDTDREISSDDTRLKLLDSWDLTDD